MFCTTLNFTKGRSLGYKNTHFFVKLKNCGTFAEDPDGKASLCLTADNRHNSGFFILLSQLRLIPRIRSVYLVYLSIYLSILINEALSRLLKRSCQAVDALRSLYNVAVTEF